MGDTPFSFAGAWEPEEDDLTSASAASGCSSCSHSTRSAVRFSHSLSPSSYSTRCLAADSQYVSETFPELYERAVQIYGSMQDALAYHKTRRYQELRTVMGSSCVHSPDPRLPPQHILRMFQSVRRASLVSRSYSRTRPK